jgi:hypothetical protein
MDYVIIDELFPLDNSLIFRKKGSPGYSKMDKNTQLSEIIP